MLADDTAESMGEYEEHYALCNPSPPKPTTTVWVTRDGQQVAVRDMSDQHLVNTIRMLRRKAPRMMVATELSLYAYLDSDPPDGAADCAESALREMEETDADEFLEGTVPTFRALLAEAEKRGLTEAINA